MTKLFVRAIGQAEAGSYRLRSKWRELYIKADDLQNELKRAAGNEDKTKALFGQQARLMDEMESFLISRCRTDDDTPVEEALDNISADDFDALWRSMAQEPSVPEASASS